MKRLNLKEKGLPDFESGIGTYTFLFRSELNFGHNKNSTNLSTKKRLSFPYSGRGRPLIRTPSGFFVPLPNVARYSAHYLMIFS